MTECKYHVKTAAETVQVIVYLAQGDILGWKSAQHVAHMVGLNKDKAFRLLRTLCDEGFVEQSDKGFRQNSEGLIKHAQYAQKYLDRLAQQFGVKVKHAEGKSPPHPSPLPPGEREKRNKEVGHDGKV